MVKIVAMIVLLIFSQIANGYSFQGSTKCIKQKDQNNCKTWKHTSTMKADSQCFPQHMMLKTRQSFKSFKQLQKGDEVLAFYQGKQIYTRVKGWFHRSPLSSHMYLSIAIDNDTLVVSHLHNIATNSVQYKFAKQFSIGNYLSDSQKITAISEQQGIGMYAPWTEIHNYFVYFGDKGRILAHDFAHLRNPQSFENAVDIILSVWEWFQTIPDNVTHPAAIWMAKSFSMLVE